MGDGACGVCDAHRAPEAPVLTDVMNHALQHFRLHWFGVIGSNRIPDRQPRCSLGGAAAAGHSRKRGFSFIVVTIAIGMFSFAFLPILRLLPVGMTVFRNSIDSTVTSQIGQQLISQAQVKVKNRLTLTGPGSTNPSVASVTVRMANNPDGRQIWIDSGANLWRGQSGYL